MLLNRRSFFKKVSGALAGVLILPKKAKPQLTVVMLRDIADKLPKQKTGKIFWMPVKDKNADRKWVRNPDYKRYYVHYDFETKVQTVMEDGEITETRKFKEDPFVLLNPNPTVSCVIFERYKLA